MIGDRPQRFSPAGAVIIPHLSDSKYASRSATCWAVNSRSSKLGHQRFLLRAGPFHVARHEAVLLVLGILDDDLGLVLADQKSRYHFAVGGLDDPRDELRLDVFGRFENAFEEFRRGRSFLPIWLRSGPSSVPSPAMR